jgi:hypothetical protein
MSQPSQVTHRGHGTSLDEAAWRVDPWNGSWTDDACDGCIVCNMSVREVLPVQLERRGLVVVRMVRRRSTVRFRKGAPSSGAIFECLSGECCVLGGTIGGIFSWVCWKYRQVSCVGLARAERMSGSRVGEGQLTCR